MEVLNKNKIINMQLQNTLENKAKFFAQYFGQEVRIWEAMPEITCNLGYGALRLDSVQCSILQLKSLSSITDEDITEVAYIHWPEYRNTNHEIDLKWLKYLLQTITIKSEITEYLRWKGYALPYLGLNVEKLIEYGWIKLS